MNPLCLSVISANGLSYLAMQNGYETGRMDTIHQYSCTVPRKFYNRFSGFVDVSGNFAWQEYSRSILMPNKLYWIIN